MSTRLSSRQECIMTKKVRSSVRIIEARRGVRCVIAYAQWLLEGALNVMMV